LFGPILATGAVNIAVAGAPFEGPGMTLTGNSSISLHVKEEFTSTDRTVSSSWSNGKRTFSLHGPRAYLQVSVQSEDDFEAQRGGARSPPLRPNQSVFVFLKTPPRAQSVCGGCCYGSPGRGCIRRGGVCHEPVV